MPPSRFVVAFLHVSLLGAVGLLGCGGHGAPSTSIKSMGGDGNWALQSSGTTERLNRVYFADESVGWAVGGRGTIVITTDGGS